MKNLDLMGVQELDAKEIMETDGGNPVIPMGQYGVTSDGVESGFGFISGFIRGLLGFE